MIPFNINMGGGGGRAATPPQDVEVEQRRRAQVVQVGLILVLLLALFDTNGVNRPPHSNMRQFKEVDKPKPSVFTDRLNSLLNENKRVLNAFPKNVTGLYRGNWLKISVEKYSPSSPSPTLQPVSLPLPVTITTSFSSSLSGEPSNSGKILMQLKSVSIDNIPDISYVYGVIRLSGASPKAGDILYPIQGVFLSSIGSLTMMTSPYVTQSLYLEVPNRSGGNTPSKGVSNISASNTTTISNSGSGSGSSSSSNNSNSSHDASLNISHHNSSRIGMARRRLADERQEEVASRPRLWKSVLGSVRAMRSSLQRILLTEDALAEFTSPDILASHGVDSAGERRRLSESSSGGVLAAIPLEFGMRLILADAASMKEFRRNQTGERYVESIGEGLLPATFKNLQSSVLHLVSTGSTSSCQIGLHFQADVIVANINDKDIPLLPGISSSSAKLTPQVGTGESFSSNLNGAIAAEECSGSGSGNAFNVSAQSYHLQVNVVERKAMNYAIIATAVCFFQMGLLVLQLRYTQTQAMASKISILGMCAQSLIDALICIGHLLLCAAIPGIFFQHFMWIAILKLMIFCVFEMRAVVSIYYARYAQEISAHGWAGLRRRLATLHFRFYGSLFVAMFLTITLRNRPSTFLFLLYSCWLPQIVYNAVAGTRRAFHPAYLYGTAISRMFIPLYVFGCPHNFLSLLLVEASSFSFSPLACFILLVWTTIQVGVLAVQDFCGPRFFIPKVWLPQRYDYGRPIPRQPSYESAGRDVETNAETCDCIICTEAVQLTPGNYMIAPCDHIFHRDCLTRWMAVKLECPICRNPLEETDE